MAMTKTLPAGTYFIGDPCYVMDDQDWLRFCQWFDRVEAGEETEDDLEEWNGVAAGYTRYGDGTYSTSHGNFSVDSGMIGVIEGSYWVSGKPEELERYNDIGMVIEFKQPFEFRCHNSSFTISNEEMIITIHTGEDQ